MTIPELITQVLQSIRSQFYSGSGGASDWGVREFKRDETKLLKAIALYGYLCDQRGWALDAKFVLREIMEILQSCKRSGVEIAYLPVYLTGSIKKRIGQRAEELNDAAKSMRTKGLGTTRAERLKAPAIPAARVVENLLDGVKVVTAVREKSGTETLADVYRELNRHRKLKQALKETGKVINQELLFVRND